MIMCCVNDVYIEHVMPPSDEGRLEALLLCLDDTIIPKLSERVRMDEYAKKLSERAELFYVTNHGRDIGNCAIYLNSGTCGYISSIAIYKKWQGRGIGTRLWDCVLGRVREKGINIIDLMVAKENHGAITFYKKIGFQIAEESEKWIKMRYEIIA